MFPDGFTSYFTSNFEAKTGAKTVAKTGVKPRVKTGAINKTKNKTKNNSPDGERVRAPAFEGGLFSKKEIQRTTPKGVRAAELSVFIPPTHEEVKNCFLSQRADLRLPDWEIEAIAFFSYYDSQGWVKSNGNKVQNWESLVTDWIMRKERELKQSNHPETNATHRRDSPESILAAEQAKLAERILSRRYRPTTGDDSEFLDYL